MKSSLLASLKLTVMTDPTVVVAMAAGLARVGAAIEEKLTELKVTGGTVVLPPPQAVRPNPAAPRADDNGSNGAPART